MIPSPLSFPVVPMKAGTGACQLSGYVNRVGNASLNLTDQFSLETVTVPGSGIASRYLIYKYATNVGILLRSYINRWQLNIGNGSSVDGYTSSVIFPPETRQHVVAVFDNVTPGDQRVVITVNGRIVYRDVPVASVADHLAIALYVGQTYSGPPNYNVGSVTIYKTALSTDDAIALSADRISPQRWIDSGDVVLHYDMRPVGGIVPDLSGNNNHGTPSSTYYYQPCITL